MRAQQEHFMKSALVYFAVRSKVLKGRFMKSASADFIKLKNQRGGSLVEFAIIAPLLFVILFGIIEFGILLFDKAMLTNASREGARTGIVFNHPDRITNAEIIQVVTDYCGTHLISFGTGSNLTISINRTGNDAGDSLTVNVQYPFQFLVFSNVLAFIGGNMGNLINLSAETVMRLE
jgi:Flp pilus assembly protein TadG